MLEVYRYRTGPGFFATLRIPLLAGRDFIRQDIPGSTSVTIINQTLAKRYFGARNPIGQSIQFPGGGPVSQLVGVVGDIRVQGLRPDAPPSPTHPSPRRGPSPSGPSRFF